MSKVANRQGSSSAKSVKTVSKEQDNNTGISGVLLTVTAAACFLSTLLFDKTQSINTLSIGILGFVIVVAAAVFLGLNKKLDTNTAIILIFVAGFVIRLDYVLYTVLSESSRVRQHDVYEFGSGKGHAGYIEHFYNNGFKLADFDPTTKAQFYHPPLHHFIAALWMRLLTTFGMSYQRAIASIQYLTLFYSCCCMIVTERILDELKVRKIGKLIAFSLVAFHPTFIILAGSINNDILSVLFILLSVYTTIKWYNDPTLRNILMIALSIGLGMTTKLSVALIAPPIAVVFLVKLIQSKKHKSEYIGQYCVFGCLCLPLGLWFSIRNFIKYKVSFTYVPKLADTSDQYVGSYSAFERLFDFSYHPFENIFLNRVSTGSDYFEYNPVVSFIKTSMFGEYNFAATNSEIVTPSKVLLVLNVILIVLSVVALVYCVVKKSNFLDRTIKFFFLFYQVLIFVNFIIFSFQYPHTCSMDYRYMVPTCVIGAIFIGMAVEQIGEDKGEAAAVTRIVKYGTLGITALFSLFSVIVFLMLGVKT